MAKLEPTVGRNNLSPLKRVSWGAIFGGTFIALAIMVLLGSLGIAIGATTIDPRTGDTPSLHAFGIGAGIWWLVSGVIALFGGGWATSRLAGPRFPIEGILHGVVTWSFTTTLSLVLMTTAVGSMISGAMGLLGTTAAVAAQGAQAWAATGHMDGDNNDNNNDSAHARAGDDTPQAGQPAGGSEQMAQMRQTALAAAEATANAVATAAWWTFFFFIATALAGAGGAYLGGRYPGPGYYGQSQGSGFVETVGPSRPEPHSVTT